jgi:acetyltransferase-like isoleucine patch superfamily enzyme
LTNSRFLVRAILFFGRIAKRASWFVTRKNVQIGEFSYGTPKVYMITDKYQLVIGNFCSIAGNCRIIVDMNHPTDWVSTNLFLELFEPSKDADWGRGDMIIGNDVWIGQDVLILPGVQIGDGAVIGAGSVVTKNVGDYEIVAGNPARHIRNRLTDKQISDLKRIKWWDWPTDKIKANHQLLNSSNVDEFIEKFG